MTRDDSSIRPWIRILWQFTVFCGILWPVAVLAQESPAPPPDGMVLWLKSDTGVLTDGEGIITQWSDQSGNSNHAYGRIDPSAQTDLGPSVITGAVNGLPAVYFGLSSFLDLPNALDGAAAGEVFLVVKKDPISIPGASYSYGALFGDNQTYYPDGTGKVMDSMGFLSDLGKPTQDIFNYCIYNVSVGNGARRRASTV